MVPKMQCWSRWWEASLSGNDPAYIVEAAIGVPVSPGIGGEVIELRHHVLRRAVVLQLLWDKGQCAAQSILSCSVNSC